MKNGKQRTRDALDKLGYSTLLFLSTIDEYVFLGRVWGTEVGDGRRWFKDLLRH